jgi:phage-related protein
MKEIEFCGSALDDLREFNVAVRQRMGQQLFKIQQGLEPDDWKPMTSIGSGVKEIRVKDISGAYRTVYIAKLPEKIYVLHCFQKKSQQTNQTDIDVAKTRLMEILNPSKTTKLRRVK